MKILTFLLCFCSVVAIAQVRTTVRVEDSLICEYGVARIKQLRIRLGVAALEGKIRAYGDRSLTRKYTPEEIAKIGEYCSQGCWPGHQDDDYEDTVICVPADPENINAWVSYPYRRVGKWARKSSIGVRFTYYGERGQHVRDSIYYFLDPEEVLKFIDPEESRLLGAFFQTKPGSYVVSDSSVSSFMRNWGDSLTNSLYDKLLTGDLNLYFSDSVSRKLSDREMNMILSRCETLSVVNPHYPSEPHQYIDTQVCSFLSTNSVKGLAMSYYWSTKRNGMNPSFQAISLLISLPIADIELPAYPFWLSIREVENEMPGDDWRLMTDIFNFHLLNSIEKEYYLR